MTEPVRVVAAPPPREAARALIRMRDGVRLAADVYLPEGEEAVPGPTVLIRTPYDKSGALSPMPLIARAFVERGYRVVVQDVRGKFASGGVPLLFVNEVWDGSDTLDWIVAQAWSDGAVGMAGNSYYGFTQWAALSSGHPALRAITPRLTGTRLGEYPVSEDGGATRDAMMSVVLTYPLTMFAAADTYFWDVDWTRRPFSAQAEEFFAWLGERSVSYDVWTPQPVHLRRFPEGHPFDARPIPVLYTVGWWDNCAPWAWRDIDDLASRPEWGDFLHLLIEPIDHYSFEYGSDDRAETATEDQWRARLPRLLGPTLEFLDLHVRGIRPSAPLPRVRWSLAGTEEVHADEAWPPASAIPTAVFAGADGTLGEGPSSAAELEWTHDPAAPVPSAAPDAFRYLLASPDEAPLGQRDDVLTFEAEAAATDTDLVGPVSLVGDFWSTGPNMDVHVRLLDLAPDGSGTRIARGSVHVLDASEPRRVRIRMGHVGYRLRAGHRLALHVAGSDDPEFLTQPGTGAPPWEAVEVVRNTHRVRVGGEHPLVVEMAVLPASARKDPAHARR